METLTNRLDSAVSTPFGGRVEYVYGYDDLNRLTSATGRAASRPGVEDTLAGWRYSDIHNLERATLVRQVTSMTGTERPPGETRDETYLYDAAHPHRARAIGTLQLDYDDDGNTIRECEGATCAPGHARLFAWDEEGRMEEANAKGRLVRFWYDADGQRMVKLAAGGPTFTFGQWWTMSGNSHATKHVFAGAGRVATKMIPAATTQGNTPPPDGSTGWPNTNGCIPSGDQPQKCPSNSNGTGWVERGVARPATWYYHSDSLGSTQWLTDDEGKLHERVEYYPYGEVWRQSSGQGVNKLKQAFLYTGKEYDSETGLTYFGARYYDSRHARWLSPEPAMIETIGKAFATLGSVMQGGSGFGFVGALQQLARLPQHASLYSYSLSPVAFVDPDGREVRKITDPVMLHAVNAALRTEKGRELYARLAASPILYSFEDADLSESGRFGEADPVLDANGKIRAVILRIDVYAIAQAGDEVRTIADVVIHESQHGVDLQDRGFDRVRSEKNAYDSQIEGRIEINKRKMYEKANLVGPKFFETIPEGLVPSMYKPQYNDMVKKPAEVKE